MPVMAGNYHNVQALLQFMQLFSLNIVILSSALANFTNAVNFE